MNGMELKGSKKKAQMIKVKDWGDLFTDLRDLLVKHDLDFYNENIDDEDYGDYMDIITQEIIFYLQGKKKIDYHKAWEEIKGRGV